MISVNNLSIRYGSFDLLTDIGFMINKRDRIGLVGKNGAGKTTLFKVIGGEISPTEGSISKPTDIRIGYLPQQMILKNADRDIKTEAKEAYKELFLMKEELERINDKITKISDYNDKEYSRMVERLTYINEHLNMSGLDNIDQEIERILKGLGFLRTDLSRKVAEFSGGWRMRIELAKILLQDPDVILLDEPTNHLDMRSKDILKNALLKYDGTMIIVSHDRYFLDGLVEKVYEFRDKKIRLHIGGIYDFIRKRKIESLQEIEIKDKNINTTAKNKTSENKINYLERKEADRTRRNLKNKISSAEKEIESLEKEINTLNILLSKTETIDEKKAQTIFGMFTKLNNELEKKMAEWEDFSKKLEEFENTKKSDN